MNRRHFLRVSGAVALLPAASALAADDHRDSLTGEIGVTTGSFMRHISATQQPGKLHLPDLPRIMRDELGLRVIDLMTRTLASMEPGYLDRLRTEAERAGCILTNLKMNNPGIDMCSADVEARRKALDEYKRTIDAAARLGVRWVRPLPGNQRPDFQICADGFRELIDHAAPKGISLLIENFGWIKGDPDAIPNLIKLVGKGLAAQPDTGNWDNDTRYTGLERAYPHAVTCDFKAFALGPKGEHASYDLKRCFDIGWKAGFRGPWCFEHFHDDLPKLFREMVLLRDMLRQWMKEAPKN